MRLCANIGALLQSLLLAGSSFAQAPQPDRWTSIVPEGAMGNVIAMYMSTATPEFSVSMICATEIPGLEIGVNTQMLRQMRPDIPADSLFFFRAGGVTRQFIEYDEARAAERTEANKIRWPGQVEFIANLYAGAPLEILMAPAGNPSALVEQARLQGQVNDPGLAQIVANCGDGRPASGEVQAIPHLTEQDRWVGEWNLRPRGENFSVPVAQVVATKHGGVFGLFCDGENKPSGFFSGGIRTGEATVIAARIGGTSHRMTAGDYNDLKIFALPGAFLTALANGAALEMEVEGQSPSTSSFSLNGSKAGIDHALGRCGPPAF